MSERWCHLGLAVGLALVQGCYGTVTPTEDAGADGGAADGGAAPDTRNDDAGTDAASGLDAACPAPAATVDLVRPLAADGIDAVAAISSDPIDETFVLGGGRGTSAYRARWRDSPAGIVDRAVYTGDFVAVDDVFVDTHGNVTVGGELVGAATVERRSVAAASSTFSSGLVVRVVRGVTPSTTVLDGSDGVRVTAVSRRGDGYFVAGNLSGSLAIGAERCAAPGAFVAGFTLEGDLSWMRCIAGHAEIANLAMHDAGDAYAVGRFSGTITLGDAVHLDARGAGDGFVARWGGSGALVWARAIGGDDAAIGDSLTDVVVTASRVVVVGTAHGATDVVGEPGPLGGDDGVVVALAALDGSDLGLARLGGPGNDVLAAIAVDLCGDAWVVGTSDGDGIVRRIDALSLVTTLDALEVPGLAPAAVAVTRSGRRVLVGGTYAGTPVIAGTALPASGPAGAAFLVGLRP